MGSIMCQYYVGVDTDLTVTEAERQYQVEVRLLDEKKCGPSQLLSKGRLVAVEGEHDRVYRLFGRLCPGILTDAQRQLIAESKAR